MAMIAVPEHHKVWWLDVWACEQWCKARQVSIM